MTKAESGIYYDCEDGSPVLLTQEKYKEEIKVYEKEINKEYSQWTFEDRQQFVNYLCKKSNFSDKNKVL